MWGYNFGWGAMLLVENHLAPCVHRAIMDGDEEALLAEFTQF